MLSISEGDEGLRDQFCIGRRLVRKLRTVRLRCSEGRHPWTDESGINANVVCPLAWTAQLENFEKAYPDAFKANVHTPPMGHFGDVEKEIGRVCVQLASPDFKYMSGETLTLEGALGQRP